MDEAHIHGTGKRIPLTRPMIGELRNLREQSGVSVPALVKRLDPSFGITPRKVHLWLLGQTRHVCMICHAHVLETWESLDGVFVPFTPQLRAAMIAERNRTGIGVYELFKRMNDKPQDLTLETLRHFYAGRVKRLPRLHIEYILQTWKALPDRPETICLTPGIVETLRAHRDRTGKGPQALLAGARDRPRGLNSTRAGRWLDGRASHAHKEQLDYLLARYAACPDADAQPGLSMKKLRNLVRKELRRTRVGDAELRRMLRVAEKRSWQFLGRDKLAEALDIMRALPTRPKPHRKKKPRKCLPWLDNSYFCEKRPDQP